MARGGFTRLPDGMVVVAMTLPRPERPGEPPQGGQEEALVRVLVIAGNRQRALTRLRNVGFPVVRLAGNAEPPVPDEINAVLHHPEGLVWRAHGAHETEPWRPASALRRPFR